MKRLIVFILVLATLVLFGNEGWYRFYRLLKIEKRLQVENERLRASNQLIRQEIEQLQDAGFLEKYIKDELGFVKNGEILYEFRDEP